MTDACTASKTVTTRSATSRLALRRLGAITFGALLLAACGGSTSRVPISYRSFIEQVQAGNVGSVTAAGSAVSGRFKRPVTYPPTADSKTVAFSVEIPTYTPIRPLVRLLDNKGVKIKGLKRSSG